MRTVKYANRFRRDYQREKSGRHGERLDADLLATVTLLAKDEPLPRRYFDRVADIIKTPEDWLAASCPQKLGKERGRCARPD